jgi:hypothetical protein
MGEVVSHLCGACGENHPHLLNLSALLVAFVGYVSYLKCKIRSLWKKINSISSKSI